MSLAANLIMTENSPSRALPIDQSTSQEASLAPPDQAKKTSDKANKISAQSANYNYHKRHLLHKKLALPLALLEILDANQLRTFFNQSIGLPKRQANPGKTVSKPQIIAYQTSPELPQT